jgi:hypothetical protein
VREADFSLASEHVRADRLAHFPFPCPLLGVIHGLGLEAHDVGRHGRPLVNILGHLLGGNLSLVRFLQEGFDCRGGYGCESLIFFRVGEGLDRAGVEQTRPDFAEEARGSVDVGGVDLAVDGERVMASNNGRDDQKPLPWPYSIYAKCLCGEIFFSIAAYRAIYVAVRDSPLEHRDRYVFRWPELMP